MTTKPALSLVALAAAGLCLSGVSGSGGGPARAAEAPRPHTAPALPLQETEEGQTVAYDAYTWQRRELAKRLPLSEAWPSEATIGVQFKRFGLDHPALPPAIAVPSVIMRDVYLVNSVPNLTYLIDAGPSGLILIDPGLESNADSILKNVEALGFSRTSIKWVINTHGHLDHAMADAHFQKLGAKILIGRADVPAVEKGTLVTVKYALPQTAPYPTAKVDWPVDDGEELKLGDKTIYAISTPGHTPGSTCYVMQIDGKTVLFGGDTILFDYRLGAQGLPFADDAAYSASLKKLERFAITLAGPLRPDVLLPGHGVIVLDRAYGDVLKGVRQVHWDVSTGEAIKALPFADDAYRKLMFGRH